MDTRHNRRLRLKEHKPVEHEEWPGKSEGLTPWAPLSHILNQLEKEGYLYSLKADVDVSKRQVVEDVIRFLATNLAQLGIDKNTGEVLIRTPYQGE